MTIGAIMYGGYIDFSKTQTSPPPKTRARKYTYLIGEIFSVLLGGPERLPRLELHQALALPADLLLEHPQHAVLVGGFVHLVRRLLQISLSHVI